MDDTAHPSRSLDDLEWNQICEAIARHALADLGRAEALALCPVSDVETAELRLIVMAEVLALHRAGTFIPSGMFRDVLPSVERIRRGGSGSGEELREIARLLGVAVGLDKFGEKHADLAPHLGRVLVVDEGLGPILHGIRAKIDDEGRINDDASPELGRVRSALRTQRGLIQRRLEELIARYREALQDGYFAEREGRYVLPVRADAPFRVEGIVLDTSASGATLYVEPVELGQLGNKLRLLQMDVAREEARVLAEMSAEIAPHADEVEWAQGVCVRADLLRSCALFAAEMGAVVVPFDEPGALSVKEARHPLLALSGIDVVPSDLQLGPGRALVLSGPNAGGKTVALKSLGLLAVMQATGLPLPVHPESRVGFFDDVLTDIGDDQSLSMSLSSFSGHVQRVREILDDAGHGTLVLFDELMSGTDPDEGAVLAIATLEALVRAGAAVCVTTHYEPLKQRALVDPHLESGAVGFDFERMEPTFRVEMGRPGASSAIIVGQRHGLPTTLIQRAVELLPEEKAKRREDTIQLEEQSLAMAAERERLASLVAEREALNRSLALELEKAKEARRRDLTRESDALRIEVRDARSELRRIRQALKQAQIGDLGELEKSLDRSAQVVALGGPVDKERRSADTSAAGLPEARVEVGMRVRLAGFSDTAEVLQAPRKGQVQVRVGVMKMSVPLTQLAFVEGGPSKARAPQPSSKQKQPRSPTSLLEASGPPAPVRSADVTVDLRGLRVEEGLIEIDRFIDDLLRQQEMGGFVLHGHGTGAMKDAVRTHLRGHQCVKDSRPADRDEGGDAFTVFWLEGS